MIKTHEWTAAKGEPFIEPGEHILCAFIIGPDRDDPNAKTLHLRSNADALKFFKQMPTEARLQLLQGATLLLEELAKRVLA